MTVKLSWLSIITVVASAAKEVEIGPNGDLVRVPHESCIDSDPRFAYSLTGLFLATGGSFTKLAEVL